MSGWIEAILKADGPAKAPAWLNRLRSTGREQFRALGFPTSVLEDWKYTSVQSIAEGDFQTAQKPALQAANLSAHSYAGNAAWRLTFVNGRFAPELSQTADLPKNVILSGLKEVLEKQPELLEAHFGQISEHKQDAFSSLNLSGFEDGAFVRIPRGTILAKPIELLNLNWGEERSFVSQPRHFILAEAASQATILETYSGHGKAESLTNAVTEIVTQEGAILDHYKLQVETPNNRHIATAAVLQKGQSVYRSLQISLGAALSRSELVTRLSQPGAQCVLDGLYVTHGKQHVDHQTTIDHATPHCTSSELYKGILDDASRGIFNGRIIVRPDAQKTNSRQTNKNLILSDAAIVNTKPLLEIYANDVKCSHGATIGRLDENQVFYLRSRGIDQGLARNLLTYAFAGEIVQNIRLEKLKSKLEEHFMARLNLGMVRAEGMP